MSKKQINDQILFLSNFSKNKTMERGILLQASLLMLILLTNPTESQTQCYLGKRHSGTLVIKYPLLCNVSLNIRVKQ